MTDNLLFAPNIVKETSQGFSAYSIQDEMLRNREINCIGEINADSVNSLIMQLLYLEKEDKEKPVVMYINSPGGSVSDGLALYDVMQAISCPVRTVCVGIAASMGAVIFASGTERDMLPNGRIMIHDPLIPSTGGSALRMKSVCDDLMVTRDIIAEILAKHTGKTVEEILQVTATDSYFRAKEALEFGLADKIITKI